ncbi:MAG: NAD-dependent succinate-semialdehyde dehydrogenase [Bacteroidota bacterium]
MSLQYSALLQQNAYLDGQWLEAPHLDRFAVLNPFDQTEIAQVQDCGPAETRLAIDKASAAFLDWSQRLAGERSALLKKWHDLIITHIDDLAYLLSWEQGKPLAEAKGEIRYGASFIEWFAEEARRIYGDVIPAHRANTRITTLKQPIGVVAAITPWNFPNAMICRKVAPALAAGCTLVIKPSEETPLSALALAQLAEEAGFPAGVINMIPTTQAQAVGAELCANPKVRKLSFTGSTPVGKLLMRQCADTVKKLSLELGGNAPFIVFEDADLAAAVKGAIAAKYRNTGQTCITANRIYVQSGIYDAFVVAFRAAVSQLKVGNGLAPNVQVGPLINQKAMEKVERLLDDATARGAKVILGGDKLSPAIMNPTILTEVQPEMDLHQEEIFGPLSPIYRFETEAEVIALANDTPFGLAAYFYGTHYAQIWRVAEALEYGMVGINTGAISTTVAPFGGVKESGIGREGSKYGIEEFVELKYMCWGEV